MPARPNKGSEPETVELTALLTALVDSVPGARAGKGFGGRPALYAGAKLFAFVHDGALVLKLPEATVNRLVEQRGATRFEMRGRPAMREWIVLHSGYHPSQLTGDLELFREAAAFVAAPAAATKRKQR